MSAPTISIRYRRLPDRDRVFEQTLLEDAGEFVVTLLESAPVERPITAGERVILDPGAPVVWFTYPGRWYDIGRFHRSDGTFTGVYANILTPVRMEGNRWETTDLCLDVWMGVEGGVMVLDEGEFAHAVSQEWIDAATAATAREHAETLVSWARQGSWPPPHVSEWDLERARARLREVGSRAGS